MVKWMVGMGFVAGLLIGVMLALSFTSTSSSRARDEERAKAVSAGAAYYEVIVDKDNMPVPNFKYQSMDQAITKMTVDNDAQRRAAVKTALDMERTEAVKAGLAEWAVMSGDHGPVVEFHYRTTLRDEIEKAVEKQRQDLKLKEKELEVRENDLKAELKKSKDAVAARKKEGAALLENPTEP